MAILPSIAYNLQNHGTDYNLVTKGDDLSAGSSRVYAWQATNCGPGSAAYLVDTLAQKCLWGSGSSVGVHDCISADQIWSIRDDGSADTYTIQNVKEDDNGFLSLYEDRSFNLTSGTSAYSKWTFQSQMPPASVTWDVCDHVGGFTISPSSTGVSSLLASTAGTQSSKMTTSSSTSTSSTTTLAVSEASSATLETSTSSEKHSPAEMTAAIIAESFNGLASQPSTKTVPSAGSQTPSGAGTSQSRGGGSTNDARCILLTALMVVIVVISS